MQHNGKPVSGGPKFGFQNHSFELDPLNPYVLRARELAEASVFSRRVITAAFAILPEELVPQTAERPTDGTSEPAEPTIISEATPVPPDMGYLAMLEGNNKDDFTTAA